MNYELYESNPMSSATCWNAHLLCVGRLTWSADFQLYFPAELVDWNKIPN